MGAMKKTLDVMVRLLKAAHCTCSLTVAQWELENCDDFVMNRRIDDAKRIYDADWVNRCITMETEVNETSTDGTSESVLLGWWSRRM